MYEFKINGINLPPVSRLPKYTYQDLQLKAWRDGNGVLHKRTVRRGLLKIELTFQYLPDDMFFLLRQSTKSGLAEFFSFTYYDPENGEAGYISEAYAGDLTADLYSLRKGIGEWTNVQVSIIER